MQSHNESTPTTNVAPVATLPVKDLPFEDIMGIEATKLNDADLLELARELKARCLVAPTRRAETKRTAASLKQKKSDASVQDLLNL